MCLGTVLCAAAAGGSILSLAGTASAETGRERFLIPGTAFSHLTVEAGSWCRYLVVDEALGQKDSSILYIAVPHDAPKAAKGYFWLEISGVSSAVGNERLSAGLLVSKKIRSPAASDSLKKYILDVLIKRGDDSVEQGDEEALAELEELLSTERAHWEDGSSEVITTNSGKYEASLEFRRISYTKKFPAGKSFFIKKVNDKHSAWFSDKVPLFHMVKYKVMRERNTILDPPIKGVPVAGDRFSSTTLELIAFGSGALTLFPRPR